MNNSSSKQNSRLRKITLGMAVVGMLTVLFQNTVDDYIRGLFQPDGIYIPQPTYKFAQHEAKGGVYSHTFRIYNLRPRTLLVQAQPDCGCTGVSWKTTQIAPFAWKYLTAEMQAKSTNATSVTIALQTNSPTERWKFVFLKG